MSNVGIFFLVNQTIISDKVEIAMANSNEMFAEHGEHYNYWNTFKPTDKDEFLFKSHAYDYYPRGRVVFDRVRGFYYLYVDKCIPAELVSKISDHFELKQTALKLKLDQHYQCHLCNRLFIDDEVGLNY